MNGQRHHGLDNSFIVNELKMKYLRKRMITLIDLDGLTPKATAEVIQGSRTGLYEGRVYHNIHELLISTLKNDPELLELEDEAEQELSQLQIGDAAIKEALDQLIQDHFEHGDHSAEGPAKSSGKKGIAITNDGKKINLDVVHPGLSGEPASYPMLLSSHAGETYRLKPGEKEKGKYLIGVQPEAEWAQLSDLVVLAEPALSGFTCELERKENHAVVTVQFVEPEGFDKEQYPLEVKISVLATFQNQTEIRLTDKLVVIKPPTYAPAPQPPVLRDDPTFIRVANRQPVRVIPGTGATHIRMRWDGKDELAMEPNPVWTFTGNCTSHQGMASLTFSSPVGGRFEALLHLSGEPLIGTKLKFDVVAVGSEGKKLATTLDAEVVEPPQSLTPRKGKADIPAHGERRPPYQVVIVKEERISLPTQDGVTKLGTTHMPEPLSTRSQTLH
jgi:hypothetical protein